MANSESTEEDLTKSFNHRESPEAATSPIEIARIRSKIEEIGSAYNTLEQNIYRVSQARPHDTRRHVEALEMRFRSHVAAAEKRQSELEAMNGDLEQRLAESELCNSRLKQRMNDLEIIVKRSLPSSDDVQTTAAEHKRLREYSPGYHPARPKSEPFVRKKSSDGENQGSPLHDHSQFDQSSILDQTSATLDLTMSDDVNHNSKFSPLRRTSRPHKIVKRENFESWKGKRLAGAPRKH